MRKKIVAGNWKMNLLSIDAFNLTQDIIDGASAINNVELIIFPPILYTQALSLNKGTLLVGVQNFYPEECGAFTGEISVTQIKDCGVSHALIGHSERRELFFENAEFLKQKVDAAIKFDVTLIFCCGEPLEIREAGKEFDFVKQQLMDSLFHLSEEDIQKCIIAYEPVWAIGTGKTASIEQVEEMHKSIRSWINESYSEKVSEKISILYGGSCNASNASKLFACPNVDGGLIGGASLQAESFLKIAQSF